MFVCDLKINLFPSLPKRSMNIFQKGGVIFCIYFFVFHSVYIYIVMMISKQLQIQLNIWQLASFFQTFSFLFNEFFVGGPGLKRSNIVSGKGVKKESGFRDWARKWNQEVSSILPLTPRQPPRGFLFNL